MSRPASSSGEYGLMLLIVGTFDLMRKVGMISKSEATITATAVITEKNSGMHSHLRCHDALVKRAHRPAPAGACGSSLYTGDRGAAWNTGTSYAAGRLAQVMNTL